MRDKNTAHKAFLYLKIRVQALHEPTLAWQTDAHVPETTVFGKGLWGPSTVPRECETSVCTWNAFLAQLMTL